MLEPNYQSKALFKIQDDTPGERVIFYFDNRKLSVPLGTNIAAALLVNGCGAFRNSPVKGNPRAAFCMMGVCFDCLVEVNGVPNRQSCQIAVKDGMVVRKQDGATLLQPTKESSGNE